LTKAREVKIDLNKKNTRISFIKYFKGICVKVYKITASIFRAQMPFNLITARASEMESYNRGYQWL